MTVDEFLKPIVWERRSEIPSGDVLAVTSAMIAQCKKKRRHIIAIRPPSKERAEFIERIRQERLAYERVHYRLKGLQFVRQAS